MTAQKQKRKELTEAIEKKEDACEKFIFIFVINNTTLFKPE